MLDFRRTLDLGAFLARDVLLVASMAAVLWGVSRWSAPLAWVVGGVCGLAMWSLPFWRRQGA